MKLSKVLTGFGMAVVLAVGGSGVAEAVGGNGSITFGATGCKAQMNSWWANAAHTQITATTVIKGPNCTSMKICLNGGVACSPTASGALPIGLTLTNTFAGSGGTPLIRHYLCTTGGLCSSILT